VRQREPEPIGIDRTEHRHDHHATIPGRRFS
jgi:hypothetical protein